MENIIEKIEDSIYPKLEKELGPTEKRYFIIKVTFKKSKNGKGHHLIIKYAKLYNCLGKNIPLFSNPTLPAVYNTYTPPDFMFSNGENVLEDNSKFEICYSGLEIAPIPQKHTFILCDGQWKEIQEVKSDVKSK